MSLEKLSLVMRVGDERPLEDTEETVVPLTGQRNVRLQPSQLQVDSNQRNTTTHSAN